MNDSILGTLIAGKYRINRVLGSGGMGTVYEATQDLLERPVAVKVLAECSTTGHKRFERECEALRLINNAVVPQIYTWGTCANGQPYLVMEYIEGCTLQRILDETPVLEAEQVRSIALQICTGLRATHEAGLIHRDIKPSNIMIAADSMVKIMDFGVARAIDTSSSLTKTNELIGSVAYCSPEHVTPARLEVRSDIYSLGAVMYRCLTGQAPYDTTNGSYRTLLLIENGERPPIPNTVPEYMRRIVDKCMARDPDKRFSSASELATVLSARELATTKPDDSRPEPALGKGLLLSTVAVLALLLTMVKVNDLIVQNNAKAFEKILEGIPKDLDPEAEVEYLMQLKNPDTVRELFTRRYQTLRGEQQFVRALGLKCCFGAALLRQGRTEDAVARLRESLRDSVSTDAGQEVASVALKLLTQQLQPKEAENEIEKYLRVLNRRHQGNTDLAAVAMVRLGIVEQKLGQLDASRKHLLSADEILSAAPQRIEDRLLCLKALKTLQTDKNDAAFLAHVDSEIELVSAIVELLRYGKNRGSFLHLPENQRNFDCQRSTKIFNIVFSQPSVRTRWVDQLWVLGHDIAHNYEITGNRTKAAAMFKTIGVLTRDMSPGPSLFSAVETTRALARLGVPGYTADCQYILARVPNLTAKGQLDTLCGVQISMIDMFTEDRTKTPLVPKVIAAVQHALRQNPSNQELCNCVALLAALESLESPAHSPPRTTTYLPRLDAAAHDAWTVAASALHSYGAVALKKGDYKTALDAFQKAQQYCKQEEGGYYPISVAAHHLGMYYDTIGDRAQAAACFQEELQYALRSMNTERDYKRQEKILNDLDGMLHRLVHIEVELHDLDTALKLCNDQDKRWSKFPQTLRRNAKLLTDLRTRVENLRTQRK